LLSKEATSAVHPPAQEVHSCIGCLERVQLSWNSIVLTHPILQLLLGS
jgi:hypothetical protein